jgi:hypothetical protein
MATRNLIIEVLGKKECPVCGEKDEEELEPSTLSRICKETLAQVTCFTCGFKLCIPLSKLSSLKGKLYL